MSWEWVWECLNNYINSTTVRGQKKNRMKEHHVINSSKKAHTSGEEKERDIFKHMSLCPGHVGDTKLPTTVKRGSFSVKSTPGLVSLRVHVFGRNTRPWGQGPFAHTTQFHPVHRLKIPLYIFLRHLRPQLTLHAVNAYKCRIASHNTKVYGPGLWKIH